MKGCKLVGKIVEVRGGCSAGHRVGEEFDLTLFSEETNKSLRAPNVCSFFYNLFSHIWWLCSSAELFMGRRQRRVYFRMPRPPQSCNRS